VRDAHPGGPRPARAVHPVIGIAAVSSAAVPSRLATKAIAEPKEFVGRSGAGEGILRWIQHTLEGSIRPAYRSIFCATNAPPSEAPHAQRGDDRQRCGRETANQRSQHIASWPGLTTSDRRARQGE